MGMENRQLGRHKATPNTSLWDLEIFEVLPHGGLVLAMFCGPPLPNFPGGAAASQEIVVCGVFGWKPSPWELHLNSSSKCKRCISPHTFDFLYPRTSPQVSTETALR